MRVVNRLSIRMHRRRKVERKEKKVENEGRSGRAGGYVQYKVEKEMRDARWWKFRLLNSQVKAKSATRTVSATSTSLPCQSPPFPLQRPSKPVIRRRYAVDSTLRGLCSCHLPHVALR